MTFFPTAIGAITGTQDTGYNNVADGGNRGAEMRVFTLFNWSIMDGRTDQ